MSDARPAAVVSRALRFGTDGVRGVAGEELTPEAVHALGRAVARVVGRQSQYLLARDTRESGPMLEGALSSGLEAEGASVESVGVFPTPGLAYLAQARQVPAAMISASHNPFHDNGIKVFAPGGRKLPDEVERRIEAELDRVLATDGSGVPGDAAEAVHAPDAGDRAAYLEHLTSAVDRRPLDGLHVVLDCANGAAFESGPETFRRLGARIDVLGAAPDGRNINAGCGSTHPDVLAREVVARGAHAGLAFDGDADRVIAVDERGAIVDGDHLMAVTAVDLQARGRLAHDTVVVTVMSNLGFHHAMARHGIEVVQTRVGDRYVLEAMDEGGFTLGGEQSGHVIFADHATTGDGVLSGLMLIDAMARAQRPLSELAAVMQSLPQTLVNVRVVDRSGLDAADEFWADVQKVEDALGAEGRVLVRPSGTEPVVRVMVEAPTQTDAEAFAERLAGSLRRVLGDPDS